MKKISLKINKPFSGKKKGDIVEISVDKYGVPLDAYWRNRLKDSVIDSCIELIKINKKSKQLWQQIQL